MDWEEIKTKMTQKSLVVISVLIFILLVLIGYFFLYDTVYASCAVEAEYTIQVTDFEKRGVGEISYVLEDPGFDTSVVGEYEILIKKGMFTHTCTLVVQDTVSPIAESMAFSTSKDLVLEASDCITNVTDAASLTYEFINEIDYESSLQQEIVNYICDQGGNGIEITSYITVIVDDEPPVISAPTSISSEEGGNNHLFRLY